LCITFKKLLFQSYYLALGLTAGGIHNFPYIHSNSSLKFNFNAPKAPFLFGDEYEKFKETWKHPKLVIDSVRVYATHPDED